MTATSPFILWTTFDWLSSDVMITCLLVTLSVYCLKVASHAHLRHSKGPLRRLALTSTLLAFIPLSLTLTEYLLQTPSWLPLVKPMLTIALAGIAARLLWLMDAMPIEFAEEFDLTDEDFAPRASDEDNSQSTDSAELDLIKMIDAMPYMIAYVDGQLRYQQNNQKYADYYRLSKDELKSRPIVDVLGQDVFDAALPSIQRALAGETVETEYCFLNDNSQIQYCRVNYVPCRNDQHGVDGFYIIIEDISKAVSRERKLIRQKEEMRLIIDTIPSCVWLKDTHNRHIRVNKAAGDFYGLTVDELEGSTAEELFPEYAASFYQEDLKVIESKKSVIGIIQPTCNVDQKPLWTRTDKYPVFDFMGNVTGILAVSTDITQIVAYEQEIKLITDAIPMFISYIDPEHRYKYNNAHYEKALNASRDKLKGQHIRELIGDASYQRIREPLTHAFEGQSTSIESTDINICGKIMSMVTQFIPDLDPNGKVQGVIVVSNDITDRRNRERESIQQKEEMRLILDTIPAFVWFKDTCNNVVRANRAAAHACNMTVEQIEGRPVNELFPDQAIKYFEDDLKVIRSRKPVCDILEHFNSDDKKIMLKTDKFPIFGDNSEITGVLVVSSDITELKESQKELILARDRAESANQSKSQFLANMSHEIRTPMTAILGYTELLEETAQSDFALDAIKTIKRNGKHLLEVINDILDLSKIESGRLELENIPCEIRPFLKELIELLAVRADEKKIELKLDVDFTIPRIIDIDPTRLRQILVNLLGNAIKFTAKGSVTLRVGMLDQHRLSFDVIDTGIGIPQNHLDDIFLPFSQADTSMTRRFGGTGLGLTISRRLAELMQGTLSVTSTTGQGSTFHLTIPLVESRNQEIHQNSSVVWAYLPRTNSPAETGDALTKSIPDDQILLEVDEPHVLLVEDGPDNQRLIKHLLMKMNFEVSLADNGQIALEKLQNHRLRHNDYDLILLDMQMPVMDGYQAAKQLRLQGFKNPIIALTAHAMVGDRDRCLECGCDDYMTKPIDRRIFKELVQKYVSLNVE